MELIEERDAARAEVEQMREELTEKSAEVDDKSEIGHAAVDAWQQATAEAEQQRNTALRDLAAATTALARIRELCDKAERYSHFDLNPYAIRAALPAAGADPAATGGEA